MKKALTGLLIFLLGFSGAYIGTWTANQEKNVNPSAVINTVPTNTVTTVKEKSDVKSAIQKAYSSVVEITAEVTSTDFFNQKSTGTSLGSGVLISEDGTIITNNHVIRGATKVTVKTSDGRSYEATLVGTDQKTDIAVIKINGENLPHTELADSDKLEIGDDAIVIGNPLGEGISVSNGIISALNKEVKVSNETMSLIQTNAAINQGNSGGGLFNINGELVGIVNAKGRSSGFSVSVEGLGYAIPSNTVARIAGDLLANGYVKNRPTLGVRLVTVSQQNNAFAPGVYVIEVFTGSAAEKAGLQKYDQILAINQTKITSYSELSLALQNYGVGDSVELTIMRNDKEITVHVTLQEAVNTNE